MRIISEHRDYYDCIQAQGQDLTCVWVRKLEEVEYRDGRKWPFPKYGGSRYYFRQPEIYITEYIVGFCGKIYPALQLSKAGVSWTDEKPTFCHTLEECDAFVESHFKAKQVASYMEPKKHSWRDKNRIDATHKGLAEFFEKCRLEQENFLPLFVDNGCPVFVACYGSSRHEGATIVYHGRRVDPERSDDNAKVVKRTSYCGNVCLKDLDFFRIVPTEQAFQEIWQYIGGVLGLNNPHVPVPDDETMRDIKGFNDWSFKKEPTKKK